MGALAKIFSLSYDSVVVTKATAPKSYYRSVRLLKDAGTINPLQPSYVTNILLCGNCVDPTTRNLYVFYIDTYFHAAWVIEFNIDTRVQTVVYYDKYNAIGFDAGHKIYNAKVVFGRLIWTDGLNPIYQMDIARAKKSFYYKIGYGQFPTVSEWSALVNYSFEQIISNGNYFYKSNIYNNYNNNPKFDNGTKWTKLCMIEDAYYSMNVKNFYFEPIPPSHPPIVEYITDDSRKINNLRQTLFQIAYRYVYMDWRVSTFSPASIVAVPQGEEEVTSGLANEQPSLNNALNISFNTGGEEVRQVQIVGRSSDDPSKWFLIDTIDKFSIQEQAGEVSITSKPAYIDFGISIPMPTVISLSAALPGNKDIAMSIKTPMVIPSWIHGTGGGIGPYIYFNFAYNNYGVSTKLSSTLDLTPSAIVSAKNVIDTNGIQWLKIVNQAGLELYIGDPIFNGDISFYPLYQNTGASRTGSITLASPYGDILIFSINQSGPPAPPTVIIMIDPADTSGLRVFLTGTTSNGSQVVNITGMIIHPDYAYNQLLTVYWKATNNDSDDGSGSVTVRNNIVGSFSITLNTVNYSGCSIVIYFSATPVINITDYPGLIPASIAIITPTVLNSYVQAVRNSFAFADTSFDATTGQTTVITAMPSYCIVTSMPSWVNIKDYGIGAFIYNGATITIYTNSINTGGIRTGIIVLSSPYGDSLSITVIQNAPPPTFTATIQIDASATPGFILRYGGGVCHNGSNAINFSGVFHNPLVAPHVSFTVYWKAYKNGVYAGNSNFTAGDEDVVNTTLTLTDSIVSTDTVVIKMSNNFF